MGERVVVEVELHNVASFQQVGTPDPNCLDSAVQHLLGFQVNQEGHVTKENKHDQDSAEDETKV